MTTAALIDDLAAQGKTLSIDGDKLRVEGPADLLTKDLRVLLMSRKPELLAVLAGTGARPHWPYSPPQPSPCPCRSAVPSRGPGRHR